MRILMLGNSFTFYHEMPKMLEALTGAEVVGNLKGGARLREQLDESSELGRNAMRLLRDEKWDYVVLQEQSNTPVLAKEIFQDAVTELCGIIRRNGAAPVLYATWPYQEGTEKLKSVEMTYEEMAKGLYESYHEAAQRNDALIADVGEAFVRLKERAGLYEADAYHPSEAGSLLAAKVLQEAIEKNESRK